MTQSKWLINMNKNKCGHEDSQLAELMIQYGNRFRTTDQSMSQQLDEAERLFKENHTSVH